MLILRIKPQHNKNVLPFYSHFTDVGLWRTNSEGLTDLFKLLPWKLCCGYSHEQNHTWGGKGPKKNFKNKLLWFSYSKQQFPISATGTVLCGCISVNFSACSMQHYSAWERIAQWLCSHPNQWDWLHWCQENNSGQSENKIGLLVHP